MEGDPELPLAEAGVPCACNSLAVLHHLFPWIAGVLHEHLPDTPFPTPAAYTHHPLA
jgi:hypothetical protein